jgi:hypothetical protein
VKSGNEQQCRTPAQVKVLVAHALRHGHRRRVQSIRGHYSSSPALRSVGERRCPAPLVEGVINVLVQILEGYLQAAGGAGFDCRLKEHLHMSRVQPNNPDLVIVLQFEGMITQK